MIALARDACQQCLRNRYEPRWTTRIVLRCEHYRALLDARNVHVRACRSCIPTDEHVLAVLVRIFPVWRILPWYSALLFWSQGPPSKVWRQHLPDLDHSEPSS